MNNTVLLSTSTCWNAGDDWIRRGLLTVLDLRREVRQLWWNRGWGIEDSYANSLNVNLPETDYVIMAGTPEWVDQNEALYRHCLRHDKPMALLGVGRTGGYVRHRHEDLMRRVSESGLVEVAVARDTIALDLLERLEIEASVLCDPAVFIPVRQPQDPGTFIAGYRGWGAMESTVTYQRRNGGPAQRIDQHLEDVWASTEGPKIAVVHDNREMEAARQLFGARNVFYSSDERQLLDWYSLGNAYVGGRIHGFVAALAHGASAHLIYHTDKAVCAETIIERLGLEGHAAVSFVLTDKKPLVVPELTRPGRPKIRQALNEEAEEWKRVCRTAPNLSQLMRPAAENES